MSNQQPPTFNKTTITIIWVTLLIVTTVIFNSVLDNMENPNQKLVVNTNEKGIDELVLERNRYGHYVSSGNINGYPVSFLLDTGATLVAIPEHIANEIGLKKGRSFQSQTANGNSTSYATTLDSITLGNITMNNVRASISTGMEFDEILLGMSFLKHLQITQKGNELRLHIP